MLEDSSKRELMDPGTDKRYVRRNKLSTSFIESDDVGRSLAADRRKRAKTISKRGEGDKGGRTRSRRKAAEGYEGLRGHLLRAVFGGSSENAWSALSLL